MKTLEKVNPRKCSSGKVPVSADPKMLLPNKLQSRSQFKTCITRSIEDDPDRVKKIKEILVKIRKRHNE